MKTALVVTTISPPNAVLRALADGARTHRIDFFAIGDAHSPAGFDLPGCDYYGLDRQRTLPFRTAALCPTSNYARKNVGYLLGLRAGAEAIVETDDDNFPREGFWRDRTRQVESAVSEGAGWFNVYREFSRAAIWPRGFPLERVKAPQPVFSREPRTVDCPVQQGLADENPDVDAVYRMTATLPIVFGPGRLALGRGTWCPTNSQNTTFFREAAALLYLPACCTMRMTDIWRGLIAQRIGWENGWHTLFADATVRQERNEHDLLRDFEDEVPGYLHNDRIVRMLERLPLRPGAAELGSNLTACYGGLVALGVIPDRELELLAGWLADLGQLGLA